MALEAEGEVVAQPGGLDLERAREACLGLGLGSGLGLGLGVGVGVGLGLILTLTLALTGEQRDVQVEDELERADVDEHVEDAKGGAEQHEPIGER